MRFAQLPLQGAPLPPMANAALHMAQAAPAVLNATHAVGTIVQPQVQSAVNSLQTTSQISAMHNEADDTMALQQAASDINKKMTFLSLLTKISKDGMQNAKDALQ